MALSAERDTPRWQTPGGPVVDYKMPASTTIHGGGMVMLNALGLAVPAAKAANCKTVGRAEDTRVSAASGDTFVRVRMGVFRWDQLSTDAAGRPEIGDDVYIEDDHTVRKTQDSNAVPAGVLVDVDDVGAWVATGLVFGS